MGHALMLPRDMAAMKKEVLLRRGMHVLIALTPLYYAIPVQLPIVNVHRWTLVVVFFSAICIFEAYRLWAGMTFLGLRPHEKGQIASFAWAAAGITAVLWLFPHDIAAAALVAMALVDPLAGELRRSRWRRASVAAPLVVYFAIAFGVLALWEWRGVVLVGAMALFGAVAAVVSEARKVRHVDDDFLMLVIPAAVMGGLSLLG